MTIEASTTLADLVIEDGRRARVLERFELDYCCEGHRTLADATQAAGVDLDAVAAALDLPAATEAVTAGPQPTAALAHDIVDTHHAYMWEEMPRLQALVTKVHDVHGDRHPELSRVRELFTTAVTELDPHMTKEERSLFPAISRLEKARMPGAEGALAEQIELLVQEHAVVGDLFKEIRSATGGYVVPDDGCASYRAMLEGLEEMERDLHEHIHKENYVLFPDALELVRAVRAAGGSDE
jgi:regulator of cell morphogenesis and NO signaling